MEMTLPRNDAQNDPKIDPESEPINPFYQP